MKCPTSKRHHRGTTTFVNNVAGETTHLFGRGAQEMSPSPVVDENREVGLKSFDKDWFIPTRAERFLMQLC